MIDKFKAIAVFCGVSGIAALAGLGICLAQCTPQGYVQTSPTTITPCCTGGGGGGTIDNGVTTFSYNMGGRYACSVGGAVYSSVVPCPVYKDLITVSVKGVVNRLHHLLDCEKAKEVLDGTRDIRAALCVEEEVK